MYREPITTQGLILLKPYARAPREPTVPPHQDDGVSDPKVGLGLKFDSDWVPPSRAMAIVQFPATQVTLLPS